MCGRRVGVFFPCSLCLWRNFTSLKENSVQSCGERVLQHFVSACWFSARLLVTPTLLVSGQLCQQHLRLLQVFGVKPFSEPAIDLGQQLPGVVLLALLLPQPRQARCRS